VGYALTRVCAGILRSTEQCRDRYFNTVQPREEGRSTPSANLPPAAPPPPPSEEVVPKKKKKLLKKLKKDAAEEPAEAVPEVTAAVGTRLLGAFPRTPDAAVDQAAQTTQQLLEKNKHRSLAEFHKSVLSSIVKAAQTRRVVKVPRGEAAEASRPSLPQAGTETAQTPQALAFQRLDRLKQLDHVRRQQTMASGRPIAPTPATATATATATAVVPVIAPAATGAATAAGSPQATLQQLQAQALSRHTDATIRASIEQLCQDITKPIETKVWSPMPTPAPSPLPMFSFPLSSPPPTGASALMPSTIGWGVCRLPSCKSCFRAGEASPWPWACAVGVPGGLPCMFQTVLGIN
jgi:hypothetical protein